MRDATSPKIVAALCTPRTPADAVKVVAMVAGSLSFFLLALWLTAAACSRKRYSQQYSQVDTFDEDGYNLGDFELGRLETKDEYCDEEDDVEDAGAGLFCFSSSSSTSSAFTRKSSSFFAFTTVDLPPAVAKPLIINP